MSTEPKYQALELATRVYGNNATDDSIVAAAAKFYSFLTGGAVPAAKVTKTVKDTPAAEVKAEVQAEAPKGPTFEEVKAAVIALVNAGNAAAGNDKTGREYAGAVLQSFGAPKVSSVKPEDYAKVLEALKAKQKSVEDEAALTS